MLLATWGDGLPILLPALAALTFFGALMWMLGRSCAGASAGWRVFVVLAIVALLALSCGAALFGLIGIAVVQCPPDAYECLF